MRIHLSRSVVRQGLVIAIAFSLGSATIAYAGPTVSGFVGLIDGTNTAKISAAGELSVNDASGDAQLAKLTFDSAGNLKTTGAVTITGTPSVSIAGTPSVTVGNFPSTQNIAGAVSVSGTPATSELFHNSAFVTAPAGELTRLAIIDVSHSEKLRVAAFTASGATAHFVFSMQTGDGELVALLDEFDVAPGAIVVRTEDQPGRTLWLFVDQRAGGSAQVQLSVWGR